MESIGLYIKAYVPEASSLISKHDGRIYIGTYISCCNLHNLVYRNFITPLAWLSYKVV